MQWVETFFSQESALGEDVEHSLEKRGRKKKDVVVGMIRKSNNENWSEEGSSGSFLINPRACWASSLSGMFRDGVCLNSLHLLMQ